MDNQRKGRPTIFDVAKESNVSIATVSRVVNDIGKVTPETRDLVLAAIKKLGFVSSNLARGLAKSHTFNVAIVVPSPNYTYMSSIIAGMVDVCKIYGYTINYFTFEDVSDCAHVVEQVISSRVEGIAVYNSQLSSQDIQRLSTINLPMVIIGNDALDERNGLVTIDYSPTLFDVIRDKVKSGVKKIVFIRDPNENKDWHMVNNFQNAIIAGIQAGGGTAEFELVHVPDYYNALYDYCIERFTADTPNGELFITPRDSLALAINNAATDMKIKTPDKLEIIGIIGTKAAKTARPTISTLDVDLYEVGSITMRMLTKMLDDTLLNKVFNFKVTFSGRDTTK